jgi:hypothetical protein
MTIANYTVGGAAPGSTTGCQSLYAQPVPLTYQGYTDSSNQVHLWSGQISSSNGCSVSARLTISESGCEITLSGFLVVEGGVGGENINEGALYSLEPEEGWTLDPVNLLFLTPNDSISNAGRYTISVCSGGAGGGGGSGGGHGGGGGGGGGGESSDCTVANPCASNYSPLFGQATVVMTFVGTCSSVDTASPSNQITYVYVSPSAWKVSMIIMLPGGGTIFPEVSANWTDDANVRISTTHGSLANCTMTDLGTYREFEFDFTPTATPDCTINIVVTQTGGTAC